MLDQSENYHDGSLLFRSKPSNIFVLHVYGIARTTDYFNLTETLCH